MGTAILGLGMAVPDRRLGNAELVDRLDTSDEWIRQRTGIVERRIATPDEATSTFAIAAGADALKDAGLTPDDLDVVIVATCTPDMPVPGVAPLVQSALGAQHAGAFDLNAGCTGFVQALAVAAGLVGSAQAQHVLVCGAETLSRITDTTDRGTAVLFGDGAGAVVVGAVSGADRIGPFSFGADGSYAEHLCVPAGGSRRPATTESVAERAHTVRMKGQDVYKHACDRMTEAARTVMGSAPVDLVVAHQANARIVHTVGERLGLGAEQLVCNVDRYGNTSAASIPIALAEVHEQGRLRDGMRVVLVAFGAGFAWGAAVVTWGTP